MSIYRIEIKSKDATINFTEELTMTAKIINGLKYWGQLLLLPVYWLSFLVPRDKKIWLFGSTFGRRFADNPRYLYLYVSQHSDMHSQKIADSVTAWKADGHKWTEDKNCKGIRSIWISHDKSIIGFLNEHGYEAYYYHSFKGIWYALRGGVYLFDNYSKDINFWQSGRALKINMWHGIPLKKIQADNVFDQVRHPKNGWERFKSFPRRLSDEKKSHYVLTTSEFMVPIFSSAFRTKHVLTSGYSRNDRLVADDIINLLTPMEKKNAELIIDETREECRRDKRENQDSDKSGKDKKMVYYMPTFRDSESKFFESVNLDRFQKFLEDNNIFFCTKLHPKSKLKKEFEAISGKNILVIDADTDPYVFLEMADVLVTDYSSIYFDFLLTGKPIVFFDYDLQEYLRDSREMYFVYEEFTPGKKADTYEKFEKALLHGCGISKEDDSQYTQMHREVTSKVFDEPETTACPRLVSDIKKILG